MEDSKENIWENYKKPTEEETQAVHKKMEWARTGGDLVKLEDEIKIKDSSKVIDNYNTAGGMSAWDVSKVTNISDMFKGATSFNQSLSNWNIKNVDSEEIKLNKLKMYKQNKNVDKR